MEQVSDDNTAEAELAKIDSEIGQVAEGETEVESEVEPEQPDEETLEVAREEGRKLLREARQLGILPKQEGELVALLEDGDLVGAIEKLRKLESIYRKPKDTVVNPFELTGKDLEGKTSKELDKLIKDYQRSIGK